jgi:hypothetical protein
MSTQNGFFREHYAFLTKGSVLGLSWPSVYNGQRPCERSHCTWHIFDDVEFFIEVNSTDGDAGVQLFLDGEQWRNLMMFNPDGDKLLDVGAQESLNTQGLTEFFFESAEPSFEEVSLEEFLARFPEGEYTFIGETIDGDTLEGSSTGDYILHAGLYNNGVNRQAPALLQVYNPLSITLTLRITR